MTNVTFREDDHEKRAARAEQKLARLRDASHHSYVANVNAVHSTAGWLLAASTAADSAGFYFAMNAEPSLPGLAAATSFLVALGSTFWCGVLVTRVHANEAASADSLRRIESETIREDISTAGEHADSGSAADGLLAIWTKVAILSMVFGGVCLVAGKAMQLWQSAQAVTSNVT